MNENNTKKKKYKTAYFKQGTMLFTVGVMLILVYYLVNNMDVIRGGFSKVNDILLPFYLGLILAYLLCPIYNGTVRVIYSINKGRFGKPLRDLKFARAVASVVSTGFLVLVIFGFVMMIIPGLWDSIMIIIPKIQPAFDKITQWIQKNLEENPQMLEFMSGKIDDISSQILGWLQKSVLPGAESLISGISTGVIGTIGTLFDVFVALVISVYVLNSKEIFKAQSKKLVIGLFSEERAKSVFELAKISNDTFGGFINGKIIDSLIIGGLCFVAMVVLKLPLAILVSVIVGVTNIIPFFGPFIGAIPSALLILIIDPIAAVKFLVLVFILQQLDGNVIGPKILGKATKLSSFWVMFAIIVSGGLFGFAGMILGVPVFAVMYTYLARGLNNRLRKKNMGTDTLEYEDFSKYNIDKAEIFGEKYRQNEEDKEVSHEGTN